MHTFTSAIIYIKPISWFTKTVSTFWIAFLFFPTPVTTIQLRVEGTDVKDCFNKFI